METTKQPSLAEDINSWAPSIDTTNKVYCKECSHIVGFTGDKETDRARYTQGQINCAYPENVTTKTIETWLEHKEKLNFKTPPDVLNVNNDCKWYSWLDPELETAKYVDKHGNPVINPHKPLPHKDIDKIALGGCCCVCEGS